MADDNPTPDNPGDQSGPSGGDGAFTPPASQEELDRIVTGRLQRDRQQQQARLAQEFAERYADYDDLKAQAAELATLREQQMSEQERAVADARKEAEAAARADEQAKYVERDRARGIALIDSFLAGATGPNGRLDAERVAPVLAAIDKAQFLTEDGGIDTDALGKLIDSLTPPAPEPGSTRPLWPGMGQGRQETPPAADVRPGMGRLRQAFGATPSR